MIVKNIDSRTKGHSFERSLASFFRKYFPNAATSRATSRALDDCKIDLNNIPFNVQCKAGYDKKTFDYHSLRTQSIELLKSKFTGNVLKEYLNYPYVLIHKKKTGTSVTIDFNLFKDLIDAKYGNNS